MGETPFHSAEALGVVDTSQYKLAGAFFTLGGIERTGSRLDYLAKQHVDVGQLRGLKRGINAKMTDDQFVRDHRSHLQLGPTMAAAWGEFQGAVAEVLCETHLLTTQSVRGQLVSNEQLFDALQREAKRLFVVVIGHKKGDFAVDGKLYNFNDSYDMVRGRRGLFVSVVHEFKSHNETSLGDDNSHQLAYIRHTFGERGFRKTLALTTATVLDVDPQEIRIPPPNWLRVNRLAVDEGFGVHPNGKDSLTSHDIIGFPIKGFAFLVFKIKLGEIPRQEDWTNYFVPVDNQEAELTRYLRFTRIQRYPRNPKRHFHA